MIIDVHYISHKTIAAFCWLYTRWLHPPWAPCRINGVVHHMTAAGETQVASRNVWTTQAGSLANLETEDENMRWFRRLTNKHVHNMGCWIPTVTTLPNDSLLPN